jgi:holo-[acyl-carrier protein] synthase
MIVGLGTDIVEISRLEETLGRLGDKFARRILDDKEFDVFKSSKRATSYLAKRFAVKEAAAKALGSGIGRGVSWQHMHTSNNELGAPQLSFCSGAQAYFEKLGARHCHVSISDEQSYAVATVILES